MPTLSIYRDSSRCDRDFILCVAWEQKPLEEIETFSYYSFVCDKKFPKLTSTFRSGDVKSNFKFRFALRCSDSVAAQWMNKWMSEFQVAELGCMKYEGSSSAQEEEAKISWNFLNCPSRETFRPEGI